MSKALVIQNLLKTYSNGVRALNDVSFSVNEGDFFALLGPNGAGKSSIIGILSSLVLKTSGKIEVFGIDVDQDFSRAKQYLGIVPQEFNFNLYEPIIEILLNQAGYYGVEYKLARQRAEYYLDKVGLWHKRHEPPRLLSGGMKRRLMIARSLLHEPKLLILDEPTAGVDIEIRHSMWKFLKELNQQGRTIILTTHYLEEAEFLCRHIGILNSGNIIENTSIKDLLKQLELETFVLDTRQILPDHLALDDYVFRIVDKQCLEVDVMKNQGMSNIFTALKKIGIEVISMRNKSNRLEKLFLDLVGQKSS